MHIRIIGDVHGKYKRYRKLIRNVENSIQVGDMGIGFKARVGDTVVPLANPPFDSMSRGNHKFIRGNHDNPTYCKSHKHWIPDGTLLYDKIFCIGGASSIDTHRRVEGLNWWEDEELSTRELYAAIDKYAELKPEIVISHECPASLADLIMEANRAKHRRPSITRYALESMLHVHRPKRWLFGHWHMSFSVSVNAVMFTCLNELEYLDLEI